MLLKARTKRFLGSYCKINLQFDRADVLQLPGTHCRLVPWLLQRQDAERHMESGLLQQALSSARL